VSGLRYRLSKANAGILANTDPTQRTSKPAHQCPKKMQTASKTKPGHRSRHLQAGGKSDADSRVWGVMLPVEWVYNWIGLPEPGNVSLGTSYRS